MSNSANSAPQNATRRALSSRHKAFATLPHNAPPILAKDIVSEENLAQVWPLQLFGRRQIFHGIFTRYHRQILYGCKNTNCQTPTCLSYQKRVSKRPFRGFTMLSARILAMFLASQDDPEKSLCPHETCSQSEALFEKSIERTSNEPQSGRIAPGSTMNFQSTSANGTSEPGLSSLDKVIEESVDLNPESILKKPLRLHVEKDPNSFTQNLFDTFGMKTLQEGRTPDYFLRWIPWFDTTRDELSSIEISCGDEFITNKPELKLKSFCLSDHQRESALFLDVHSHRKMGAAMPKESVSSRQLDEKQDDIEKMLSNSENLVPRPADSAATSTPFCASNVYIDSSNSDSREQAVQIKQQDEVSVSGNILNKMANSPRELRTPLQGSNITIATNYLAKSFPRPTNDSAAILASQNEGFLQTPHTLRMFTLENISALVASVKTVHPKLHEENHFVRRLGRTPTPSRFQTFVHCFPTPRERNIAFGTQCIVSILGSTDALLKSFLAHEEGGPSRSNKSVGFSEIVHAFRSLMEIDYHPNRILSSLWISTGKVHLSTNNLSRNTFVKTGKAIKPEFLASDGLFEHDFMHEGVLSDGEAAHIVKIAFASLVASVAKYSPNVWFHFQTLRATGASAPKVGSWYDDKDLFHSLLDLMDTFEGEAALNLVVRLVRAVTARRWVSKMSKCQETGVQEDEKACIHDNDFMNIVIREILIEPSMHPFSARLIHPEPPKMDSIPTDKIMEIKNEVQNPQTGRPLHVAIIAEWLRSVVLREWNGKAEVSRWGAVGSALEFLSSLHRLSNSLEMDPAVFYNLSLSERLEVMDMPTEWLASQQDRNTVHLLSYPFLFLPSDLVSFYRAINHSAMFKAFEGSMMAAKLEAQMTFVDSNTGRGEIRLHDKLKTATSSYLVLEIRREDVLTDALNQLWRRERRELMRPLKVRMGMDEGEEGVDHGGVQQEFFRIALSESMRPDYGLFTTDTQTQMLWFQPCSLEPLHKFELLGLLTSLAVYNGLTLPVTFPLALYRKLLDLPVTELQHIEDGWPSLARGFKDLLTFYDEDSDMEVEDVFQRSYVFNVEALGRTIYVEMDKIKRDDDWTPFHETEGSQDRIGGRLPSLFSALDSTSLVPPADDNDGWVSLEASNKPTVTHSMRESSRPRTSSITSQEDMVTERNRDEYVADYIFWLTDKSIRPQYEAFARGFYTCLDRKATTIFSPELLKRVVEGTQHIDIDKLERTATYAGGYHDEHPTIKNFWSVVRELPTWNVRRLLEFVTASDRIPVNGISNILFVVQKNGAQDDRLPTSLTCFGVLLLPEYSSREILEEKLCIAINNSKGFGVP